MMMMMMMMMMMIHLQEKHNFLGGRTFHWIREQAALGKQFQFKRLQSILNFMENRAPEYFSAMFISHPRCYATAWKGQFIIVI